MAQSNNASSWRKQLSVIKDRVIETEKQKELEEKLHIQRTKEGIAEKLAQDTPEELDRRYREIENGFRAGGRELFPVQAIQEAAKALEELSEKVSYYLGCMKDFQELFLPPYPQVLNKLKAGLAKLTDRSAKQVQEWSNVKLVTDGTQFRPKQPEDEPTLLHVAKTYHKLAHGVELNLPKNFFAKKAEGFWVATFQDIPYAYVMQTDAPGTFTIAVGEVIGANFVKLVRGFMHKFTAEGPIGKLKAISVRVTSRDEVKFFTGLNFLRTDTRGMSDWTYTRSIP